MTVVLSERAGFTLSRYEIRGNRYVTARDIRAALAIDRGTPLLSIDPAAAAARIERLAWVKSATVRRILPDGLSIEIIERDAAAVWRTPEADRLIDGEGRILSEITRGTDVGLPVLSGAGAAPAAAVLLQAMASNPQIATRLIEARRIADRRWTLLIAGGTAVELPADGIDAALAWLASRPGEALLDAGLEAIDLRVSGQLVVRKGDRLPAQAAIAAPFEPVGSQRP
jgi:cell division protein FtsQ